MRPFDFFSNRLCLHQPKGGADRHGGTGRHAMHLANCRPIHELLPHRLRHVGQQKRMEERAAGKAHSRTRGGQLWSTKNRRFVRDSDILVFKDCAQKSKITTQSRYAMRGYTRSVSRDSLTLDPQEPTADSVGRRSTPGDHGPPRQNLHLLGADPIHCWTSEPASEKAH